MHTNTALNSYAGYISTALSRDSLFYCYVHLRHTRVFQSNPDSSIEVPVSLSSLGWDMA